ncbi:MAG TPA: hypothetical protein VD908_14285 [Cytophagales bacterium]|nr:hypothetical protein [Cytophagales bacterium]
MNRTKQNSRILLVSCFIFSVILFLIHFLFFRHTFPETNIDEASFFSPAYSFAEKGTLSSDLHSQFLPGASKYTYWMPPLYMFSLGLIFKVLGSSIFVAKFMSFLYAFAAAIVLTFLSKNQHTKIWIFALFLICPFVILSSSFIRMETLGLLIVSASILSVKNEVKTGYLGGLAALAVMTHPLLGACAAALAFVAARRGLRQFVFFTLAFLVIVSPYLFYISLDFELFKEQMSLQLLRKSKKEFSSISISYILQSLPIALIALYLLWKIKKYADLKYFLLIGITLSLILILKSGEFNYHIYLIPYAIAIIALYRDENLSSLFGRLWIPVSFYCFFCLLLFAKMYADKITPDASYKELLETLKQNPQWNGKEIYVYGMPDVSIFLIEKGQNVKRQNAVASKRKKGWESKYNFVIQIIDHLHPRKISGTYPWFSWKNISSYKTSDGHYTLITYAKE